MEVNNQKKSFEERYNAYQTAKLDLISNLNDDEQNYISQKAIELGNNLFIDEISNLAGKIKSPDYTSIAINQAKRLEDLERVEIIKHMSVPDGSENVLLTPEQEEENLNRILEVLSQWDYLEGLVTRESSIIDQINNMLNTYHSELPGEPEVDLAALIDEIENS